MTIDGVDAFGIVPSPSACSFIGDVCMDSDPTSAVGLKDALVCKDGLGMPKSKLAFLDPPVGLGLRLP